MYLYLFNDLLLITQPKKAKQSGGDARPKKTKLKEVLLFKTQYLLVPANGKPPFLLPSFSASFFSFAFPVIETVNPQ